MSLSRAAIKNGPIADHSGRCLHACGCDRYRAGRGQACKCGHERARHAPRALELEPALTRVAMAFDECRDAVLAALALASGGARASEVLAMPMPTPATPATSNGAMPKAASDAGPTAARRGLTTFVEGLARVVDDLAPGPLTSAPMLVLATIASYSPDGCDKVECAIRTVYAHDGGGFGNIVGALRSGGFLTDERRLLRATAEGIAMARGVASLRLGAALVEKWQAKLQGKKAERLILAAAAATYPNGLTRAELAERSGYEPTGGGFGNALGRLHSLGLVRTRSDRREVAASSLFVATSFDEASS